jgi:hypothetical protein
MDDDSLLCIFELLNLNDIYAISLVCVQFNKVANNEFIWKSLFNNKFDVNIHDNYKCKYKEYHALNNFLLRMINKDFNCAQNYDDIYLNKKHLQFIPKEIGLLARLRRLELLCNNLQSIPKEFGLLTELCKLDLRKNKLQSIPSEFGLLTKLKILCLGQNQISSMPNEFGLPPQLRMLILDHNELQYVPTVHRQRQSHYVRRMFMRSV